MSDNKETRVEENNSEAGALDLSQLRDFSFGPQWSMGSRKEAAAAIAREKSGDHPKSRQGFKPGGKDRRKFGKNKFSPRTPRPAVVEKLPFVIELYPEDAPFVALSKAMKASCQTYELFEIAKLILEKPDRFIFVLKGEEKEGKKTKLYLSAIDSVPFEQEDEAINYTLKTYQDRFFKTEEAEVEAPKGSFPFIHKCGITGALIAPPNYHRYAHLLQEHHRNHCSNIPFEQFKNRLVQAKEKEDVDAWTEQMKKTTKYILKENLAEGQQPKVFDTWEDARHYIVAHRKQELVKERDLARIPALSLDKMPETRLRAYIESVIAKQREFPLLTANNLRGRMRRMNFAIYKKGTKGVSYVCAVKRKFRTPVATMSENLTSLIEFIEKQEKPVYAQEIAERMLGIEVKPAAEGEAPAKVELTAEQDEQKRKILRDLRWLVSEGYVVEYGDGKLFANPVLEAHKAKEHAEANSSETESMVDSPQVEGAAEESPKPEEV